MGILAECDKNTNEKLCLIADAITYGFTAVGNDNVQNPLDFIDRTFINLYTTRRVG
ncbi:hypothetical protein [Rodentibacter caecimuris]|uniref:hypothetical protein n=1 Tax=Rodentibacter caecimuris TaxID=1796644 RepID=UPI000856F800|nr:MULTISPECIES: hypothetical protein [Pasteurellaceae]AOF54323.1 hypothetical protein AC062_2237 [Pasteurellaceae bacterium NI1060]MCQ9122867.1 hypothetical protein [Rodentibacter heylii]MCR1837854.1 hypothetical protein [Pasteurella caecimuris]MCU0106319.1 hypothetical protein [Pasteurella caecimuris]MCX2960173.1 hypothetical protein [Rodentibacter heylii]